MNTRSLRTLAAVATAIILIVIGVFLANRSGDTGTSAPQPASATSAPQPASATSAPQPASATSAPQPASATSSVPQSSYPITADQAGSLALASAPGSKLSGIPTLVSYQNTTVYEVTLDTGLVYVDATSGQLVASTVPNASTPGTTGGESGEHENDDDDDD